MTGLYHVYGEAESLLYIGVSKHFGIRWQQHARKQPWWNERRRMTVDWYDTWDEALNAEALAIFSEKPKYNVRHREQTQRAAVLVQQLCLNRQPQELTKAERVEAARIVRLRISDPDFARLAESQKCRSCGAQPGELCHTASGKLAYYHQFRWGDFRRRPDAGRTIPAEPDLIGM
jgi:predicted GIY-YIG superfamily endonuclease